MQKQSGPRIADDQGREKREERIKSRSSPVPRPYCGRSRSSRRASASAQIAQRVDLARSTVQRIVAALAAEKLLIAASPTGRVRLGTTILRLAASARTDFVALARPFLVRLSNELNETVDLRDHQERPPHFRRPGHRPASAARGVGGRRSLPALLHGERQGLSRSSSMRSPSRG